MVYFVDFVQVFQSQTLCTSLNTIVIPENTRRKSIQTSQSYSAKFSKFYLAVSYGHPPDPIVHSCGDPSSSEERARSLLGRFLNSELSKSKAFFIAFFRDHALIIARTWMTMDFHKTYLETTVSKHLQKWSVCFCLPAEGRHSIRCYKVTRICTVVRNVNEPSESCHGHHFPINKLHAMGKKAR